MDTEKRTGSIIEGPYYPLREAGYVPGQVLEDVLQGVSDTESCQQEHPVDEVEHPVAGVVDCAGNVDHQAGEARKQSAGTQDNISQTIIEELLDAKHLGTSSRTQQVKLKITFVETMGNPAVLDCETRRCREYMSLEDVADEVEVDLLKQQVDNLICLCKDLISELDVRDERIEELHKIQNHNKALTFRYQQTIQTLAEKCQHMEGELDRESSQQRCPCHTHKASRPVQEMSKVGGKTAKDMSKKDIKVAKEMSKKNSKNAKEIIEMGSKTAKEMTKKDSKTAKEISKDSKTVEEMSKKNSKTAKDMSKKDSKAVKDSKSFKAFPKESKPAEKLSLADSQSATEKSQTDHKPETQMLQTDSKPELQMLQTDSKPESQMSQADSKPEIQMSQADNKPETQMSQADSKPEIQVSLTDSKAAKGVLPRFCKMMRQAFAPKRAHSSDHRPQLGLTTAGHQGLSRSKFKEIMGSRELEPFSRRRYTELWVLALEEKRQ